MRILYSHRIQSRDGQSVHIDEMVAALRAEGHEVLVVGPRFYAGIAFGAENRAVAALRRILPGILGELAELAYAVPATLRLRRAYRSFRPHLIYERYNLYHVAGALLARRGALLFLEVNAPLAEERAQHGNLRLGWLARVVERATWRSAARILAVTGVLRDIIAASGGDPGRIQVVHNGIVPNRFRAPLPASASGVAVLGFVGFVRDWHGLDQVITALAVERSGVALRLSVVGDGPARPGLMQQSATAGIADRVEFAGIVDPACIPALVAKFDIALQPKVTSYASPLKLFDYMAAGCAIVAPDQPNIREVLTHEESGLLFDPAQPGAMWQAIERLAEDPDLRHRLGQTARARVFADFTWQGNARRIADWAAADIAARKSSHDEAQRDV